MKGLEENRWCMGRGGCILWEGERITDLLHKVCFLVEELLL